MGKEAKHIESVEGKHIHNTIMVCGATGFIGSHLVAQLLKQGYTDIHIISRDLGSCKNLELVLDYYGARDQFDNLHIHYGAITNFSWLVETLEGCHTVFNCAATVDMNGHNAAAIIRDNVTLTYLIGEAALRVGADRIVHVSSISALSAQPYPTMTTEENHLQTIKGESPYAISKFYSENEMWRIAEKGIKVITVNPAVVLGFGDWNRSASPMIFKKVAKGIGFYSSGIMGYVMVDDVASAMIQLSICDKAVGERFILCGANLSYRELLSTIAKSLGKKAPRTKVADWILSSAATTSYLLKKLKFTPKYSDSLLRNLISKHCYDGSKIKQYTDFDYCNITEKITKVGNYYKFIIHNS